ncbi:transmembrane protease serine 9-like [Hyperolius riggenbachi]|uniref:transmembrane protease serine 9-like n=1 Tax=Hyperolius riggenbachi TaxID=752182 RepID=UPI0035A32077
MDPDAMSSYRPVFNLPFLVSSCSASVCGIPKVSDRIVGGMDSVDGEWPWQVSLQFLGYHVCGGSLISSQWVMSAAHCFLRSNRSQDYKVLLGMYQLFVSNPHEILSRLDTLIIHPQFTQVGDQGDIALLKLANPVAFTNYMLPVCLPSSTVRFPCAMECWVTGWGHTSSSVYLQPPGTLQKVMTPLIDDVTCDLMYHVGTSESPNTVIIHDYEICAGYPEGKKDSCQGDSGGPLVCKVEDVWYQVGIVSWGEGCALPYRPGVYSLVTSYQSWIGVYVPDVAFTSLNSIPQPSGVCGEHIATTTEDPGGEGNTMLPVEMRGKIMKDAHYLLALFLLSVYSTTVHSADITATTPAQPTCGMPVITSRIVGGTNSAQGAWPWQISLRYLGNHICGGSLISNQWVLCAAHCFEFSSNPADYTIILGEYELYATSSHQIQSKVQSITINPQYNGAGTPGDISLIKLSSPVTFTMYIQPVCVPPSSMSFPNGMSCWVTGWGNTGSGVSLPHPGILQQVMVPLISRSSCDQMYHTNSDISSSVAIIPVDQICAGYQAGHKDSCQGDSGGPLVCNVQGVWYQVGVVSWGDDCALVNRPGVYTYVPYYYNWIYSYGATRSTSSASVFPASLLLLITCLLLHR